VRIFKLGLKRDIALDAETSSESGDQTSDDIESESDEVGPRMIVQYQDQFYFVNDTQSAPVKFADNKLNGVWYKIRPGNISYLHQKIWKPINNYEKTIAEFDIKFRGEGGTFYLDTRTSTESTANSITSGSSQV
jgi:hypothetical protein